MTWQNALAVLAFCGFVVLLWNSHHLTRWFRRNTMNGTIFEDSVFDSPAWMESPWVGRVLATLVTVGAGASIFDR